MHDTDCVAPYFCLMNRTLLTIMLMLAVLTAVMPRLCAQDNPYADHYRNLGLAAPMPADIPELIVNIRDYGGRGDAVTLNTEAFAVAIEDLSRRGGGHLVVPEGVWLTGPVVLRSNIDLHIEKNAIVLFSPDRKLYPETSPDEGTSGRRFQPLISAYREKNVSISGEGVLDGNGEVWRPVKRFKMSETEWEDLVSSGGVLSEDGKIWYPSGGCSPADAEKSAKKRPRMLRFLCCENVMLDGVIFQNSPSFHVNLILCNDVVIDGISVRCPWNAQNGDGIDLSSCRDVLVKDCMVDAGDDAICLKSGVGEAGRRRGPCERVVVTGCTVFHGHGGFVIGSDTAGGMNDIHVSSCRFLDTDIGIRIKSGRGRGGEVRRINISDIVMNDIKGAAILIDPYYQENVGEAVYVPVDEDTPSFSDIRISRVVCRDAGQAMYLRGLPERKLGRIAVDSCSFYAFRPSFFEYADEVELNSVAENK